jgi:antitoxin HigA-1
MVRVANSEVSPPHPGCILRERILPGLQLSVSQAARELRVARRAVHRVLAGTAAVTPERAARIARLSGPQPQFWLNLQQEHDRWYAEQALAGVLQLIPAHTPPALLQIEIGPSHDG